MSLLNINIFKNEFNFKYKKYFLILDVLIFFLKELVFQFSKVLKRGNRFLLGDTFFDFYWQAYQFWLSVC
jgi:hypothetical protein